MVETFIRLSSLGILRATPEWPFIDLMVNDHTQDLAAFQKAESSTQDPSYLRRDSSDPGTSEYGKSGRRKMEAH